MNTKTLTTLILVIGSTILTKCPDATENFVEKPKFKLGFEIESDSLRIIKDEVSRVIARNIEKTSKFHVDTFMHKTSNGNWVFENDSLIDKRVVTKRVVDFLEESIGITANQDWFTEKVGIENLNDLNIYTSEFHTVGGLDCVSVYDAIEEGVAFFIKLYLQGGFEHLLEIMTQYQSDKRVLHHQMGVNFLQYVNSIDSEDTTMDQNFIMNFNNENNKNFIKGFIRNKNETDEDDMVPEYKKFAESWFNLDPNNLLLEQQQKEELLEQYEQFALAAAPILTDRPTVQATIQIPLEYFPTLMQKLSTEIEGDQVHRFLNQDCGNTYSATGALCLTIKSMKCGEETITKPVLGLSLIFLQFLTNGVFDDELDASTDANGIKTFFRYLPRTSIKKMYLNLSQSDKKVFKCIFNDPNNYKGDHYLLSYKTDKNATQTNNLTLQAYIDSIFGDINLPDALSPAPGMSSGDSLGNLGVPGDCPECAVVELRFFGFRDSPVESEFHYWSKGEQEEKVVRNRRVVLMKDVDVWFKAFAREFYEIEAVTFVMKEESERII